MCACVCLCACALCVLCAVLCVCVCVRALACVCKILGPTDNFETRYPIDTKFCCSWVLHRSLFDPVGLRVIILASESEVRGFDPGQGRWIFSERKNPEYDFLRNGSKAVGPVS